MSVKRVGLKTINNIILLLLLKNNKIMNLISLLLELELTLRFKILEKAI